MSVADDRGTWGSPGAFGSCSLTAGRVKVRFRLFREPDLLAVARLFPQHRDTDATAEENGVRGRALYYPPPLTKTLALHPSPGMPLMTRKLKEFPSEDSPQKWTAGVDWFRYRTADFADTRPLLHAIRDVQQKDTQKASSLRPWRFQGYDGWQTETIRWGQRGGRVIWESSGEQTRSTLGLVALCTGSASRIDLQITMSLSRPQPTFGHSLLTSITPTSRRSSLNQIRRGLHMETSGLWLGTVGRRTNRSYLRIYDKGVESRLAPRGALWRIELEAKGTHSAELCKTQLENLKRPAFCGQYCVSSLKLLGLSWPYGPLSSERVDIALGRSEQSTPTKLAAWLVLSVRPVIQRLLTVYSATELRTMLGLSDAEA